MQDPLWSSPQFFPLELEHLAPPSEAPPSSPARTWPLVLLGGHWDESFFPILLQVGRLGDGEHLSQSINETELGQEASLQPAGLSTLGVGDSLGCSCNSFSLRAVSSLQSSPDFSAFPKLEQPEEDKYSKPAVPTPPAPPSPPASEPPKADLFEQKVVFSGFGPIMRFSTTPSSSGRVRAPSPGDYKSPHISASGASAGTHKRMPALSATPAPAEETPEVGLKERKHKASKRSRHGPGRPRGSRNKDGPGGLTAPSLPGAQLAGFTATAASPFSGGSLVSCGLGGLASRTFGPSGSLPSLSLESPLLGAGKQPLG